MKNKSRFLLIIIVIALTIFFATFFAACSKMDSSNERYYGAASNSEDIAESTDAPEAGESAPERKIIYKIYTTLYVDSLEEGIAQIRGALKSDERMDYESISNSSAYFTARVKTERLDEFVTSISKDNNVYNYEKTSRDVTINYYDNQNRITALEAEQARLIALYQNASIKDTITIYERLGQVERELINLQSTINQYDSLIEYSEVVISLHKSSSAPTPIGFGARLNSIFKGAWKALGAFFGGIIIFITAAFPFIIVLGPVVVGIIILVKYLKKRKLTSKNEDIGENNNEAIKTE